MDNLSWKIGNVTVTRIVESDVAFPIYSFFPSATPTALVIHKDWLQLHFIDDNDQITISFHSLVVQSQGKTIVVDTCIGEHGDPFAADKSIVSSFLEGLAKAGFPREEAAEHIDKGTLVIGTHYPAPTAGHLVSLNGVVQLKPY